MKFLHLDQIFKKCSQVFRQLQNPSGSSSNSRRVWDLDGCENKKSIFSQEEGLKKFSFIHFLWVNLGTYKPAFGVKISYDCQVWKRSLAKTWIPFRLDLNFGTQEARKLRRFLGEGTTFGSVIKISFAIHSQGIEVCKKREYAKSLWKNSTFCLIDFMGKLSQWAKMQKNSLFRNGLLLTLLSNMRFDRNWK